MQNKLFLLCGMLLLIIASAFAALPPELASLPLEQDPDLLSGQLPNGLSYYIMRNAQPEHIAEMRLLVDVGSVNEDDDQRGLAHFTEHMVFNGTKNFDRAGIVNYLSSIGMGYYNGLNGGTTYDMTMYTFRIPTDDQDKLRNGLLILSDMAWQVSFRPEEIERERGVIIEEWRMGQDADSRIRDAQDAVFLAGSRYAERSPIGTYDVLSTFKPETLTRFYHDWYRPDLQSVVIVGDFDPQAMLALVEEYFGVIPARTDPRPREDFPVPDNLEPEAVVSTDPEFTDNEITVRWKKEVQKVTDLGGYYDDLVQTLFYTMLNSRLEEYSKQADPPYAYAYAYEFPYLRTLSLAFFTSQFTAGKSEEALTTLLSEAERVQRYGFLPSEFERAKIELLRDAEQQLAAKDTRESRSLAWRLLALARRDGVFMSPEQNQQLLEAVLELVSPDEVNALASHLIQEQNMCVTLSAPEAPGATYPSSQRLLDIVRTVGSQEIAAYEDVSLDEPLMAQIPQPRPVKKESFDAKTGLRKWILANGVTVYSKKTDFKADEVMLAATSPGGYSLVPPSRISAARLVSGYVADSGFGNFDSITLRKATVGKIAGANLSVSLNSEGCEGYCSPKDMELMFQMLYQYATNPRFNQADFASYIQRAKANYANRNRDPMNVFFDKMSTLVSSDNVYYQSLASADFDAVLLADLERVWQDRFGDFSDFSFFIVGNFDEAQLRDYCQTYLANLPSLKRNEKPRDVGFRSPKGVNEVRFNMGASDRSFVAHYSSGAYKHNLANEVQLKALEFVLNEKLRENIRENLSGVYFIQSMLDEGYFPRPSYSIYTIMGCSPARVDELNAAITATLDSLRAGYLDERYLVAARATLQQQFTENLKDNRFWQNQIVDDIRDGRPLAEFLRQPEFFDKISYQSVIKAARKYLNHEETKLSLIMLPGSNGKE